MSGPLGAGKTALAQGVGSGLRVAGSVTSPTFVIARVHRPDVELGGTLPMVHVDAYRLGDTTDPLGEIDDLDLDATIEESVTLVEWGEGLVERLAGDEYLEVRVERSPGAGGDATAEWRVVTLYPHGTDWTDRVGRVEFAAPQPEA